MKEYYSKRAQEFEQSYYRNDPERQAELLEMTMELQRFFADSDILEIACGTGYWTERVATAARSVTGIDITEETLEIAENKKIPNAQFFIGDAYRLDKIQGSFDGVLANFWFSHIPKDRTGSFIDQLHARLGSGAKIFMADNMFVDGVGGELVHKPGDENTYKLRTLNEGTSYEIIKNYYTSSELKGVFESNSNDLRIHIGRCFWWISYTVM